MEQLPWNRALERYTELVPTEVLQVYLQQDGQDDLVVIYRGFSSSLMRPTPKDLSQPVIDTQAQFLRLDRLQGPLDPANPQMIQADLDQAAMVALLQQAGLEPTNLDSN